MMGLFHIVQKVELAELRFFLTKIGVFRLNIDSVIIRLYNMSIPKNWKITSIQNIQVICPGLDQIVFPVISLSNHNAESDHNHL